MSNDPPVRLDGVEMVYSQGETALLALSGIDVSVRRGEFLSIIGPSGCGKSTLLRIVGGLQAATSGGVAIDGQPPRQAQRRKEIGFAFQDASLLAWRTVLGNIRLPLEVNRKRTGVDAGALVDLVGLSTFRGCSPHHLSGGMQQRVALARSLVTSPSLLLMDEPFGALDEMTRSAMRYELLRIWRSAAEDRPCTVLFVTHSITEAVLLSDRVLVMTPRPGRVAALLEIDLPRPRREEIETDPLFLDYAPRLRTPLPEPAPG